MSPWPGLFLQEPLPTAQGQPGELQVNGLWAALPLDVQRFPWEHHSSSSKS